jgi:N-methylhydantoinase A
VRYLGQSFELAVEAGLELSASELRERFEAEHLTRYGFRDPDAEIELVTVRVSVFGPAPELELPGGEAHEVAGVVALAQTTVLVPEGWRAQIDAAGTVSMWMR